MAEIKFKIIEVKDIETKDVPPRKFKAYKTVDKTGRKMDVRFTRECSNVPTEPCTIVCDTQDCNVDTRRQYPILWVKDVQRIETLERKSNVSEFFEDEPDELANGVPL